MTGATAASRPMSPWRRILRIVRSVFGLAFLMLLLTPLLGPPLYAEVAGAVAPGSVAAKREVIDVAYGSWTRRLFVDVRFRPAGSDEPEVSQIAVDLATYDQLRAGDSVRVRYAPNATLRQIRGLTSARLATQLPLASFVARLGGGAIALFAAIAVWLLLLWIWSKRRSGWLALALFVSMFAEVLYAESGWPGPAPAGPFAGSTATVQGVHQVTRIWQSRRRSGEEAAQPYSIVELAFVPQGMADPVVAVDLVDAKSVPGLEKGGTVPISYSLRDPRWARIDGATRTYYWKNLRGLGLIGLGIGALILLGWLFGRRRAARRGGTVTR